MTLKHFTWVYYITAANWSDWVGVMVTRHFDLVFGLFRAPRAPKRALLAPKGPVGGPIGSQRAPGDQIWSQLLSIVLPGEIFQMLLSHLKYVCLVRCETALTGSFLDFPLNWDTGSW